MKLTMGRQHLIWKKKMFTDLSLDELYKIMQLRQEVFILEQACVYQDLDGKDQLSSHLMAWHGAVLVAYTRLVPYGLSYPDAMSVGRVVTAAGFRGQGLGAELMRRSINGLYGQYGHKKTIKISVASEDESDVKIPVEIAENAMRSDYIVLEAIVFPGINFFWFGTILMMFAFGLSMWNRRKGGSKR